MKKQSVLLAAVSILLLSSCQKSADEIAPSSSSAISELSMMEGDSSKNKCNGDQKPQGPPPPEKVMTDLDVNQDGSISLEEAKGPLVNDFTRIDANADGLISLEELKAGSPPPPVK